MIPETQLDTWAKQGATSSPKETHEFIRNALSEYEFPEDVKYEVYLQGSYKNNTNIYADSDVDIVVELISTFKHNLPVEEAKSAGFSKATYFLNDFRTDVMKALRKKYNISDNFKDYISSGCKSIKVDPKGNKRKADVVVSMQYRNYSSQKNYKEGIIFSNACNDAEIINYPELHYQNGVQKHSEDRTNGWFKPTVRIFKNARNKIKENKPFLDAPSYFLECLLFNVPDEEFGTNYQTTVPNVLNWLSDKLNDQKESWKDLKCQNQMLEVFGYNNTQWGITDARSFVSDFINLWNNWNK